MIFNPKEELVPPVSVPAPASNNVPYYTPNPTDKTNLLMPQALLPIPPVPPEQDKKIQQLELVSHTRAQLLLGFKSDFYDRPVTN